MMQSFKEKKDLDDAFKKAQKSWHKLLDKVGDCRLAGLGDGPLPPPVCGPRYAVRWSLRSLMLRYIHTRPTA